MVCGVSDDKTLSERHSQNQMGIVTYFSRFPPKLNNRKQKAND